MQPPLKIFFRIGTAKITLFLSKTKRKVIYLIFKNPHIFQLVCLPDSHPASQPAISPGSRALKITLNNGLPHPIYKTPILKTIIPLRHGDAFVLPSNVIFSIH